ncbi:ABC transporter permease [Paenibacillus eucommiae]|uniref:ABC-type transport system involved in multi-copper enzyme maturation permease subunit n=1 Tax=Paenibacillus eucommiae TaxID=1355755 RepID=A0ABS4J5F2_9BACL|nr:ABC transporter permease [Paenibacillus eucommiae]MBP1995060.1 ABC-type transport system involved in multi-copper enzyme maturation permease subunit [Paenibacillus eucommiae]
MSNYLKSELYRLVRKKAFYFFLAICMLGPLIVTLLTATTGGELYANTEFAFKSAMNMWSLVFIIVPIIVSFLVSDEFTDGALKNTVAYGITRSTVFYGKWIMELLFLGISWLVTYISLTASVFLLLQNNGTTHFMDFTASIAGVLPLVLAALTVSHCLCFLTEKPLPHLVSYALIIIALPELYFMFAHGIPAWREIVDRVPLFPYAAANDFFWMKSNGLLLCWIIGTAYVLLAFLTSARWVKTKEFK